MTGWDAFNKYVGVQGIMAIVLLIGYVVSIFIKVEVPSLYDNLMTLIIGYYFAKNGVSVLSSLVHLIKADVHVKTKGK